MKPIKLIALWFGPLPLWYAEFAERMDAQTHIDFELVRPESVDAVNRLATDCSGTICRKSKPYDLCDLRPLFGQIYAEKFVGYDFWGWCDLDIVVGDLSRLIVPILRDYDIISTDGCVIHGAMTLLRNTPEVCNLYRSGDYKSVLADPSFCNFDEAGFNEEEQMRSGIFNDNPNFTEIVNESGMRVLYDDRSWTESKDIINITDDGSIKVPARCCHLIENSLLEVPTWRELTLYHFTDEWPIPNRYGQYIEQQYQHCSETKPSTSMQENGEYWANKVKEVVKNGRPIHTVSCEIPIEDWNHLQLLTSAVVRQYIPAGSKVLDAGCSYGPLLDTFKMVDVPVDYTGIDLYDVLIKLAMSDRLGRNQDPFLQNMSIKFMVADINKLPFENSEFDWCICRSVEGTAKTMIGLKHWYNMEKEMLRVSKKLILINLQGEYRILEGKK